MDLLQKEYDKTERNHNDRLKRLAIEVSKQNAKEEKFSIDRLRIEDEIRYLQSLEFYGTIEFSFNQGILQPICNKKETKEIK